MLEPLKAFAARPTAGIDREALCMLIETMHPSTDDLTGIAIGTEVEALAAAILPLLPTSVKTAPVATPAKTGERGAVIEECARIAESVGHFDYIRVEGEEWHPGSPYDRGQQDRAIAIAKAIRALSQPPPDAPIVGGES